MLLKSLLVLITGVFLAQASLQADDDMRADNRPSYVKLEVRGTLFRQDPDYYIQTHDSHFHDVKLLVRLGRTEDKNWLLDRHLEGLRGKTVVANGFLDCRRVGQEAGVLYIYLTSESQVTAIVEK